MKKHDKNFVILTSHGRTATSWISVALNLHPDFFCTHSRLKIAYKELLPNRLEFKKLKMLQDESINYSVNQYFDAHLDVIDVPNYVSIHNFQIISLRSKFKEVPPDRDYRIVNLVRHPVTRFKSYVNSLISRESEKGRYWLDLFKSPGHQQLVDFVRQRYDVDFGKFENIAFICAMITLQVEIDELKTDYLHIPVERLLLDRQFFCWFLNHISHKFCTTPLTYLDKVFSLGRVNKSQRSECLPVQTFASLPDWQKAVWRMYYKKFNLSNIYDRFGYDLNFITQMDDTIREPLASMWLD